MGRHLDSQIKGQEADCSRSANYNQAAAFEVHYLEVVLQTWCWYRVLEKYTAHSHLVYPPKTAPRIHLNLYGFSQLDGHKKFLA